MLWRRRSQARYVGRQKRHRGVIQDTFIGQTHAQRVAKGRVNRPNAGPTSSKRQSARVNRGRQRKSSVKRERETHFFAHIDRNAVNVDHVALFHRLVAQHFAQRGALAAARNEHAFWRLVRQHCSVHQRLVVHKLVRRSALHFAVEHEAAVRYHGEVSVRGHSSSRALPVHRHRHRRVVCLCGFAKYVCWEPHAHVCACVCVSLSVDCARAMLTRRLRTLPAKRLCLNHFDLLKLALRIVQVRCHSRIDLVAYRTAHGTQTRRSVNRKIENKHQNVQNPPPSPRTTAQKENRKERTAYQAKELR